MITYHDTEWGVPLHNDLKLFEFLVLDAFQAGLSWAIILKKREHFRRAFAGFDPKKISRFTSRDVERLLKDEGIIRNKLKIEGTLRNARAFLDIQRDHGSFDHYIWQFVQHAPLVHTLRTLKDYPAKTAESDEMSRNLKKKGFTFAGSTICYAFMQAAGLVNDHTLNCFRRKELMARKG